MTSNSDYFLSLFMSIKFAFNLIPSSFFKHIFLKCLLAIQAILFLLIATHKVYSRFQACLLIKYILSFHFKQPFQNTVWSNFESHTSEIAIYRSSPPQMFFRKDVLKICNKFTGEHLCLSVISTELTLLKSHFGLGALL